MTPISRFYISTLLVLTSSFCAADPIVTAYLNSIQSSLQYNGTHFTGTLGPLVNCINSKAELDVVPIPADIDAILEGLSSGNFTLAVGLVEDKNRSHFAAASLPILSLPSVLLSRDAYDPASLSDVRVMTASGSGYKDALSAADAIIEYADSYTDALMRFSQGEVDAIVIPTSLVTQHADLIDADVFQQTFSSDNIVYYVSNTATHQADILAAIEQGMSYCITY